MDSSLPRRNAAFTTVLLDIRKLTVLLACADATVLRTNRLPGRQIFRVFVGRLHSYTTQISLCQGKMLHSPLHQGSRQLPQMGYKIVIPCCLGLVWDLSPSSLGPRVINPIQPSLPWYMYIYTCVYSSCS